MSHASDKKVTKEPSRDTRTMGVVFPTKTYRLLKELSHHRRMSGKPMASVAAIIADLTERNRKRFEKEIKNAIDKAPM